MLKTKLDKISFPILQYGPNNDRFMKESDDIMNKLAKQFNVDTEFLWEYHYFAS
jgi:hypothetical protein